MLADPRIPPIAAAAERIRERRAACDDTDTLPDDPAGIARYVRTHRKVPAAVLAADLEDALVIRRALREESDREDLGVIQAARACGVTWARIAKIWGFRGRQGAEQMKKRLEAATGPERRRDERAVRPRRAAAARESAWLGRNDRVIHDLAAQIVGWADLLPATLAGAIEDLAGELESPDATPDALIGWLSALVYDSRYPDSTAS